MSYTFKPKQEEKKESKFIAPGIHDVKITKIEAVEPEGKSAYLALTFENTTGQTTDDKLFFSEAAAPYSLNTIESMMGAIGVTSDVNGKTLTETAKKLFSVMGNKLFRHRFTGEEIQGGLTENGEQKSSWFKAKIGRKFSNESVSTEPSRLKPLDKANQYDWKTLPKADTINTNNVNVDDSLPF